MSVKKLLTPPLPLPYKGGDLHADCLQLGFLVLIRFVPAPRDLPFRPPPAAVCSALFIT
jgi:hypothetical protein